MQISLRDIAETTLEGFSGLVEIDHSDDTPRIENSVQTLASTAIGTEASTTAVFNQMTANVFTPEERAALPTFETSPAAGEIIFNDPNRVQDVNSGAPQQDIVRTEVSYAPPVETTSRSITAEYRRPEEVFAYAERIGDNIERAHLGKISGNSHHQQAMSHDLKVKEAKIGGMLFGEVPKNDTRTFFNLDTYTWVWNEVAYNAATKTYTQTAVEYDVQPQGVLKVVNGEAKGYIEGKELSSLMTVMKTYHDRVLSQVYGYETAA